MKGLKLLWNRAGRGPNELQERAVSDAQLAERLKQKDQHAFLQLYDLHRRAVYRFLMHMTGSIAAAEELTQDVFVAVLDSMCAGTAGQFNPEKGTWEGYLLGIARNLARAERRKINRVISLESILETPEWSQMLESICQKAQVGDIAALLAAQSELKALHGAILELPAHYREALVLCSLQEKSYRDAAAILQCSEGTVASRLNRAKGILAAKLRRPAPKRLNLLSIFRGKEGADVGAAIETEGS